MWEMLEFGRIPYASLGDSEVLKFLQDGGRLEKPEGCPDDLYAVFITELEYNVKLMTECWKFNFEMRPSTFQLLLSTLQEIRLHVKVPSFAGNLPKNDSGGIAYTLVPPPKDENKN